MTKGEIIEKTKNYVRSVLEGEGSGHDWWHIERVWKNAVHIGKEENVDMFVVELGALLHDIADWKFHDEENAGGKASRSWLQSLGVDKQIIAHVCEIVNNVSFKGGNQPAMKTKEGMVVQDADRLDAMGAIGIARTFAYGGFKHRVIYNPTISPKQIASFQDYKKAGNTAINHFYEKLLLLKDLMNTRTGKKIAEDRHKYMEDYLKRFYEEWEGKK